MKQNNFKKRILAIIGLALGVCFLAPTVSYACADYHVASAKIKPGKNVYPHPFATSSIAIASSAKKFIKPEPKKNNFCAIFSNKYAKVSQQANDNQAKLDAKRAEQSVKFYENWAKGDKKLADSRLNTDKKRAEQIVKLQRKASSSAEQAAVAAYKISVDKAVTDRRTAIDAAMSSYKIAFDKALADRKTSIDQAAAAYKNAVQIAYAKASSSCQSAVDKKTIQKTLNADLKAARDKFNADSQSIGKFNGLINPLIKARQQAIANAVKTFQTAINKAKTDLKAAFSKK